MGKFIFHLINGFLFLFLAIPLFVLVAVSFTDAQYLTFPPKGLSLKWYVTVFQDDSYMEAFKFSTYLAIFSTLVSLIIGVPASQVISRHWFPGKNAIMSFISSPMLLPQIFFGVALLQFFYYFTSTPQNFWTLSSGHIVLTLPYIVRTCTATFASFNRSIEEAAEDLGANKIKTFFTITLPMIKSGVIAGALFAFAISWINVEVTIFLSSTEHMALPVKMFNYVQYTIDPTIAAVSAVTIYLSLILILVIDYLVGIENIASK